MRLRLKIDFKSTFLYAVSLMFLAGEMSAAVDKNSWSLTSPDGQCAISLSLGADGSLSYQASRAGKMVIEKSPLGLRLDNEYFEKGLVLNHAGKIAKHREKYELFGGTQPKVDRVLNYRSLVFRNT